MREREASEVRARVHERGNRSLEGVLHLIEVAGNRIDMLVERHPC